MKHLITSLFFSMFVALLPASAQKWSVAVNAAEALQLGTISLEGGVAVGQHASINATAKFNPWTFNEGTDKQFQHRHQTYSIGARWWPWNVYSGWWLGGKAQYQEYNHGGIISQQTEEGDAFGLGICGGYSLMIGKHFNMDFGLGLWGGKTIYTVYARPAKGRLIDSGSKWFILPNDLIISFAWIF